MSELTSFKSFKDERGYLLPISFDALDFIPKRVFIVNGVPPGCVRGNHSHYKTKQILICLNGEVEVVCDDGEHRKIYRLTKPHQAIYIPEMIWDEQRYLSEDSVLLVLSNTYYDPEDYIEDYDEFIKIKKNENNKNK